MNPDERLLKYVAFDTTSDEDSETVPSAAKELVLGKYLAEELGAIGLEGTKLDDKGYVYGFLPASEGCEQAPVIALVAHMDTSPAVSGADIKPRRIQYEGGDIVLSDKVSITEKSFPFLKNYVGQELIVTDGTTLLGADDKAGVAEIFTAMEYLLAHPEVKHGRVAVCITPDEEIGRGADFVDVKALGADFGYTVDGGTLGELEYENFNAAGARFTVNGVNIHPGSAKNKMKNAVLIAAEFISLFPAAETPAHTEGYEGFYHFGDISGNETCTKLSMIIRDHDREKFEARKAFAKRAVDYINSVYGEGTIEAVIRDSYYNMKELILPHPEIIARAEEAYRAAGITPVAVPIRGGTDGARLSYEGLPCPNLSTGGENFHGIHEFVSVPAMRKMVEVLVNILKAEES